MMSKAAFLMNEHLKRNIPLVQEVHPTCLMARARLPFPQGLEFIATMFRGKGPAEIYTHQWFIEKQTDPTQPSPQYHLTEEYQGMIKVVKGLWYMNDKTAKLDTTMLCFLDPTTRDVFLYNPHDLDEASMLKLLGELAEWGVEEAAMAKREMEAKKQDVPMELHNPDHIQNQGSELSMSTEAHVQGDLTRTPSVVARKRTDGPQIKKVSARIGGIILPTRQSLWEPLKSWARIFPNAPIYTSLGSMTTKEKMADWFSPEELQALEKRVVPITQVAASNATLSNSEISLAPSVRLYRVLGDSATDEFVLHHQDSKTLSCTDLFHGSYGDYDPVNTWLCRVFFKFMKDGNYKRIDIPPKYKLDAVVKHGDLKQVQQSIEFLCDRLDWDYLLFAHGTPPQVEDAKGALRGQWTVDLNATQTWKPAGEDNPDIYGDVAKSRPEDDFLLRRRRF